MSEASRRVVMTDLDTYYDSHFLEGEDYLAVRREAEDDDTIEDIDAHLAAHRDAQAQDLGYADEDALRAAMRQHVVRLWRALGVEVFDVPDEDHGAVIASGQVERDELADPDWVREHAERVWLDAYEALPTMGPRKK